MHKNPVIILVFALLIISLSPLAVEARDPKPASPTVLTATGIIRSAGITTYMYGTHVLVSLTTGRTLYALKSETIRLDDYSGRKVTVKGALVSGYPVDGGPEYMDVRCIESAPRTDCPQTKYINCMPPVPRERKELCSRECIEWIKEHCPGIEIVY